MCRLYGMGGGRDRWGEVGRLGRWGGRCVGIGLGRPCRRRTCEVVDERELDKETDNCMLSSEQHSAERSLTSIMLSLRKTRPIRICLVVTPGCVRSASLARPTYMPAISGKVGDWRFWKVRFTPLGMGTGRRTGTGGWSAIGEVRRGMRGECWCQDPDLDFRTWS